MPRKLDLTARQVTALCNGAAQAGYIPVVQIGDVTIRLVPEKMAAGLIGPGWGERPINRIDQLLESRKGRFGSANKWKRESAAPHEPDEARWEEEPVGSPLNKRERDALQQLAVYGIGVAVPWRHIQNCGPATEERPLVRGFLETRPQAKYPDRIGAYVLTEAGLAAWEKIKGDLASAPPNC